MSGNPPGPQSSGFVSGNPPGPQHSGPVSGNPSRLRTPGALGPVVDDTTGPEWEADRAAVAARELSFAEFLDRRGLVLRSDLLGAWTRWITPEFEPRRYDTWFFVAALPEGQRTRNASTEADRTVWIRPEEAAARYDAGELTMMPPTIATLRQLIPYGSAAEALAAAPARDMTPVLARARLTDDEVVLSWPGHDEFTKHIPIGVAGGGPA